MIRKKCFYCGQPSHHDHHIYLRMNSDITVPLCWRCHVAAHSAKGHQFFEKLKKYYEHQQRHAEYYTGIQSQ